MTTVGFNFTKIDAIRNDKKSSKVNISNNVSIKDVKETDLSLGPQSQKALKFSFEFVAKYEPDLGNITLNGDVLFMESAEKSKKILDEWKKDKKISNDLMTEIMNTILSKSNIQALLLSQEMNLPSPIPLPKVKKE